MEISTIIPLYNAKSTIKNTIKSVLNQTYSEPIEIIVVNDGSTDGSEKIVEEIITNNETNRIIKLINKSNGGVSSARNKGIEESTGEYIGFLDSDDIWHIQKLYIQINIMKKYNVKISGTYNKFIKMNQLDNEMNINYIGSSKVTFQFIGWLKTLFISPFATSGVILHKSVKEKFFDETMKYSEDYDLWLKIMYRNKAIRLSPPLVYVFKHNYISDGNSLSTNLKKMQKGINKIFFSLLISKEIKFKVKPIIIVALFFSQIKYLRRIIKFKMQKK